VKKPVALRIGQTGPDIIPKRQKGSLPQLLKGVLVSAGQQVSRSKVDGRDDFGVKPGWKIALPE